MDRKVVIRAGIDGNYSDIETVEEARFRVYDGGPGKGTTENQGGGTMETNKEYQRRELNGFLSQKNGFFDTVPEFNESLREMDIEEQIGWIENGSYGAGACFALQSAFRSLNNRTNKRARIGHVVLHAFYGKPFRYWNKLSIDVQAKLNEAIDKWLDSEKNFAQELE